MKKTILYIGVLLLAACQHQLHFPETPVAVPVVPVVAPHEKIVGAIVITDPTETDYDSLVYHYAAGKIREVHFSKRHDSVTRTYYYDAAGRLSKLEDEKAIYYTNNDQAKSISFQYDASGQLQQTVTDFTKVQGVIASYIMSTTGGGNKQMVVFDTAYISV